ncbi:MAG: T9SS type A sorting domain-containing protein [Bacteroidota bacterium]
MYKSKVKYKFKRKIKLNMRKFTLLLSFICLQTLLSAQSSPTGTIVSGGLTREYRLYVPAAYNAATPVPLLFNLHGYGSNNLEQDFYGNFKQIADTANFIIAMPNGTFDNQGKRYWNNFIPNSGVDDVAFISNLLDTLRSIYNIDLDRVYSTGMSNGGFMSYELAAQLNNRIAAIASVAGDMITPKLNALNPARPVPVMEIHGNADATVPYDGLPASAFAPIENVVNKWVTLNHCNPTPTVTDVPNTNTSDGCTATHYVYGGGDQGSTVEFYKINGGGHTWPGAAFNIGVTNMDINASIEIWRFLRKYRLSQFPTATLEAANTPDWQLFPNPATNHFTLQSEDASKAVRVRVFDAQGRLVSTIQAPNENTISVPVNNWLSGWYGVLLETENGVRNMKVFVGK